MDPLTQGALGAAVAMVAAPKDKLKYAAICGILGGMAPDLDVLFRKANDPLFSIEYHRHFTHALAFIPIGGLLVALFLWLCTRMQASFKLTYLYTTLGYATHGLLDACTSYGTRLYWPFSDERVAWNIISIVDPIFTLTLLLFIGLCLWRKSSKLMRVGLCMAICYLGVGMANQYRVHHYVKQLAQERGHVIDRILFNPTIGNNILWRSVYASGDTYYIDALLVTPFVPVILYQGTSVPVIDPEAIYPQLASDSVQREDIRRFAYFSQGYIYEYPGKENVLGDLRYGTLPYDDKSLWGIEVNPDTPGEHVKFGNLRDIQERHLNELIMLLRGKVLEK